MRLIPYPRASFVYVHTLALDFIFLGLCPCRCYDYEVVTGQTMSCHAILTGVIYFGLRLSALSIPSVAMIELLGVTLIRRYPTFLSPTS